MSVPSSRERAEILSLLADLLDYPRPELAEQARACRELVADDSPAAAELLDAFVADVETLPPGRIEELYSGAFDLATLSDFEATCHPYVGHHLLGENHRRSRFMAGLAERYHAHGFEARGELPDHVVVMLRFLAHAPDGDVAEELVSDALLPALARMTRTGQGVALEGSSGRAIYVRLLEAARLVIGGELWPGLTVPSYENVEVAAT